MKSQPSFYPTPTSLSRGNCYTSFLYILSEIFHGHIIKISSQDEWDKCHTHCPTSCFFLLNSFGNCHHKLILIYFILLKDSTVQPFMFRNEFNQCLVHEYLISVDLLLVLPQLYISMTLTSWLKICLNKNKIVVTDHVCCSSWR